MLNESITLSLQTLPMPIFRSTINTTKMATSPTQILSKTTPINLKQTTFIYNRSIAIQLVNISSISFPQTNHKLNLILPKCTTIPTQSQPEPDPFPTPATSTTTPAELFPIEKRRPSEIIRDRKSRTALVKPEPPNFELGWKRTKPINLEKPTGYMIMDFLEKLDALMEREYGSTELLAKTGEIVSERAREEAEILLEEGKVEDRMVTELSRVLKLMEMDLVMVKAAVKEDTINQRLEQARARCRQAFLVAKSF